MAVPKRKTTPSKRNMRRSHHRAGTQLFAEDKKSGELRRPHHIDLSTGMYVASSSGGPPTGFVSPTTPKTGGPYFLAVPYSGVIWPVDQNSGVPPSYRRRSRVFF